MSFLGNLIWFIFAGFWQGLGWIVTGLIWSITIIGLPIGVQCFKLAALSFAPFGKEVVYSNDSVSLLLNILWLIFGGLSIAFASLVNGFILCLTIIGIPFGKQCFKQAKLALMPFGAQII
ncbi:MAG: YccF domain-containing protein [Streptococcaceae bacterium]|jgi:uncharacterized membrane protein YccF (DUF307 family)|nr:YccF domain-containing protein [Streptococcaceae bacterium]